MSVLRPEELTWAAFAFTHGMLELERSGRLTPGPQLEAIWEIGIQLFGGSARDPSAARVGGLERDLRAYADFIETLQVLISALPGRPEPGPSPPKEITEASPLPSPSATSPHALARHHRRVRLRP